MRHYISLCRFLNKKAHEIKIINFGFMRTLFFGAMPQFYFVIRGAQ